MVPARNEKRPDASIPAFRPLGTAVGDKTPARHGLVGSDQAGLLDQAGHDPVLGLGDRARFGDLNRVTHRVLALFVKRVAPAIPTPSKPHYSANKPVQMASPYTCVKIAAISKTTTCDVCAHYYRPA